MSVLIPKGTRNAIRSETGPMVLGMELHDAREELFVAMVCDGLSLGVAFKRAGFESKHTNAPYNLFHLPRLQERAQAILKARATTGVVSLGEVTSMLQRVFAGANAAEEYSAAHNAALSLARIYGHVTDRASIEVIRRPSRDPDAPSEAALEAWAASLPVVSGPGPEAPGPGLLAAISGPPAAPLEPQSQGPAQSPNDINALEAMNRNPGPGPSGPEPHMHVDVHSDNPEKLNDIKGLAEFRTLTCIGTGAPGRSENGAPNPTVTGTPNQRGRSSPLGPNDPAPGPGPSENGAPIPPRQVPGYPEGVEWPDAKELF